MSRIGSVLTGDRSALGDGPPVHAMLIQNTNPVVGRARQQPGAPRLRCATTCSSCVHEQFMTETARWPTSCCRRRCSLEHDDIYQAGGHSHIQIGPKLIEPPGECRSNHEVLQGLAHAAGRAASRASSMTAMEIIDATLRASGWPDAADGAAERRWIDAQPSLRATRISSTAFGIRTSASISRRTGRRSASTMPRHAGAAGPLATIDGATNASGRSGWSPRRPVSS